MKASYLVLISAAFIVVLFAVSWCKPSPKPPSEASAPSVQQSPPLVAVTPTISPTSSPTPEQPAATLSTPPSPDFRQVADKVGPAVVLVTVFDSSGRLLRNGTGFFVSDDGRLITNWHVVEGGAHAVAKSPDGKIRNVSGVLASSDALDLAVLKADTKRGVPFLPLNKVSRPKTALAVVGSSLQRQEQPLTTVAVSAQQTDSSGELFATSAPLSKQTTGAPLVDENGEAAGVVTIAKDSSVVVRPASALVSLLARITPEAVARWASSEAESPTPSPTPKKLRIVSNPAPVYPQQARRSNPPMGGTGRFRILFDANGQAREVQVVQSTGQSILDEAAVEAFQRWKSEPGHEWSLVVPITFTFRP